MTRFGQEEEERVDFGRSNPNDIWEALDRAISDFGRDKIPAPLAARVSDRTVFDPEGFETTYVYHWPIQSTVGWLGWGVVSRTPWPQQLNLILNYYSIRNGITEMGAGGSWSGQWSSPCSWAWNWGWPPWQPGTPSWSRMLYHKFAFDSMNFWDTKNMVINDLALPLLCSGTPGTVGPPQCNVGPEHSTTNWLKQVECGVLGKACPQPSINNPMGVRGLLQLTHGVQPATVPNPKYGFGYKPSRGNVAWFFIMDANYCDNSQSVTPPAPSWGNFSDNFEQYELIPFFAYRPGIGQTGKETYEELFGGPPGSSFHPTRKTHGDGYDKVNIRIIDWTS